MRSKEFLIGKTLMGRLPKGEDLLTSIEQIAEEQEIKVAKVDVLGAVEKAVIGFYDQDERYYKSIPVDQQLEIVQASGNITQKDGSVKAHIHVTLGDREGKTYSGHLMNGTIVFAGEVVIQELIGPELHRMYDEPTGLPLWDL